MVDPLSKLRQIELYKVIEKKYKYVDKQKESDCYANFLEESGAYLKLGLDFREPTKRLSN